MEIDRLKMLTNRNWYSFIVAFAFLILGSQRAEAQVPDPFTWEQIMPVLSKPIQLDDNAWVAKFTSEGMVPFDQLPENFKIANDEILEFNRARPKMEGREDDLRIFLVEIDGFEAKLDTKWAKAKKNTEMNKANIYRYFDASGEAENVTEYYNVRNMFVSKLFNVLYQRGYTSIAIYVRSTNTIVDAAGKTHKVASSTIKYFGPRFTSSEGARARNKITAGVRSASEQTLQAVALTMMRGIAIEIDGDRSSASVETIDCGKSPDELIKETFKVTEEKLTQKAKEAAAILANGGVEYRHNNSPFVLVDNPAKFKSRHKGDFIPDTGLIDEIMPDKLELLTSNSGYQVYVLFQEVDFVLPRKERSKYAARVYNEFSKLNSDSRLVIVVPYYLCKDNPQNFVVGEMKVETEYPLYFMPAVAGFDEALVTRMNVSMVDEPALRVGFDQMMKFIPKNYTAYVWRATYDGKMIYNDPIQKDNITGFSNIYDIVVLVDDRLELIRPHMECIEAGMLMGQLPKTDPGDMDPMMWSNTALYNCVRESREKMREILQKQPRPTYKLLNPNGHNMKQSLLASDKGEELAMFYATASLGKYASGYWDPDAEVARFHDNIRMEKELFYEGKSPFEKRHWVLTVIDAGSLITSVIGLDFIFDGAGAIFATAIGEYGEAKIYMASVLIPAAVTGAFKLVKAMKVSANIANQVVNGSAVLVKAGANEAVAVSREIATVQSMKSDGMDVARALGMSDGIAEAVKADAAINAQIQRDIRAATQDQMISDPRFNEAFGRMNTEPRLLAEFGEALNKKPNTSIFEFLEIVDKSPKYFGFGRFTSTVTKVAEEPGYFTLAVGKVESNGNIVGMIDGKLREVTPDELGELMMKAGYSKVSPIRIIGMTENNMAELQKLSDHLAQKFETLVKTPHASTFVDEAGEIISKNTGFGLMDNALDWNYMTYKEIYNADQMFVLRNAQKELTDQEAKIFPVVLQKVKKNGDVIVRENNRLVTWSPTQLGDYLQKNGLRKDETVQLVLTNPFDGENLDLLANALAKRVDNSVLIPEDVATIFDVSRGAIRGNGRDAVKWIDYGERKALIGLTEENFEAETKEKAYTVFIKDVTEQGKVRVKMRRASGREYTEVELSRKEFIDVLKKQGGYDGELPITIVATVGTQRPGVAAKFVEDLAEETGITIRMNDGLVPNSLRDNYKVAHIDQYTGWLSHVPVGKEGTFLNANLSARNKAKLREYGNPDFDKFLGRELSVKRKDVNFVDLINKNETWMDEIHDQFLASGNGLTLSAFHARKEVDRILTPAIGGQVFIKLGGYKNAKLIEGLSSELKWIDKEGVEMLKNDLSLLDKAAEWERVGKGTLSHLIAAEQMAKRLPRDMVDEMMSYGMDGKLVLLVKDEVMKLGDDATEKLARYFHRDGPDMFTDFAKYYQSSKKGLSDYLTALRRRTQLNYSGADRELGTIADDLDPEEGFFDVVAAVDGNGFVVKNMNGSLDRITPEEMANLIRSHEGYKEGMKLRFAVKGDNASMHAQEVVNIMDVPAKVNTGALSVKEGKLLSNWNDLKINATSIITDMRKFTDPQLVAGIGKDAATLNAIKRLKPAPGEFIVAMHASVTKSPQGVDMFYVLHNGSWVGVDHRSLLRWLKAQPGFNEAKTVRLVSCGAGSAATDAERALAQKFADKSGKDVIAASGSVGASRTGEVVAMGDVEDAWYKYKKSTSATPEPPTYVGKIRKAVASDDALAMEYTRYAVLHENVTYKDWYLQLVEGQTERKYAGVLNMEEETALNWYVREGPSLNEAMVFASSLDPFQQRMATTIREALDKLKVYRDGPVYRGIGSVEFNWLKEQFLNAKNSEVLFKDFKSTSKNFDVAKTFNKGQGPNGESYVVVFNSHSGMDISPTRPAMEEVLIGENSKFRITRIDAPENGIIKIHMEDVATAPKVPSLTDLYNNFKRTNPDPYINNMVESAAKNKQVEVLNQLLGGAPHPRGAVVGASGRRYGANLTNTRRALDQANPKYLEIPSSQLDRFELKVVDGLMVVNGRPLAVGREYKYVMDGSGRIFVSESTAASRGVIEHSSFLPGQNLASAGTIRIDNGYIHLSNNSEHFMPVGNDLMGAVQELTWRGVDIKAFAHMNVVEHGKPLPADLQAAFREFERVADENYRFAQMRVAEERLYPNELAQQEEAMLIHFAGEGNHEVNDMIIQGKSIAHLNAEAKIMNDVLRKLQPSGQEYVFRGAGFIETGINKSKQYGDVIEFRQFLYTSKRWDRAAEYMNSGSDKGALMYRIKQKSAVDVSHLSEASKHWDECISPTNTRYQVVGNQLHTMPDGKVINVVDLVEL